MIALPILATFISVALWTILNIASKRIATGTGAFLGPALTIGIGVIPMLIATLIVGTYNLPIIDIALAIFAGLFAAFGSIMVFRPLVTEQLSNTVVLGEVYPPVLILFGVFILGENLTGAQGISILIIFVGAFLVITNEKLKINRKLIPALIAPISWAGYWIILTYAINGAGTFALPVLISRIVATVLTVGYIVANKKESLAKIFTYKDTAKQQRVLTFIFAIAIIAGLADGIGDTLFAYTVGAGYVAIGSALSALAPIAITIVSIYLYKDKFTALQLIGFAVMVVAAVALSFM